MSPDWAPLALLEELAEGPLSVRWDRTPWLVVRLDGAVRVMHDLCPHRRVPLSIGQVVTLESGQAIECGYHGWAFGADGRCAAIPALGAGPPPRGMGGPLVLPVRERHGVVWAARTDRPLTGVPVFPTAVGQTVALRPRSVRLPAEQVAVRLGGSDASCSGVVTGPPTDRAPGSVGQLGFALRSQSPTVTDVFGFLLSGDPAVGILTWLSLLDDLLAQTAPA